VSVCGLTWPAVETVACHGGLVSLVCREAEGSAAVCHITVSVSRDDAVDDGVAPVPGSGVYVNVNPVA